MVISRPHARLASFGRPCPAPPAASPDLSPAQLASTEPRKMHKERVASTMHPWRGCIMPAAWHCSARPIRQSHGRPSQPAMPLIFTLASRNLFHDRLRFVATVVGIVFSIVLVTVQLGLYLGFGQMVTTMIDHAVADLWIMPNGTKCFEDPSLLDERKRFQALSINGVMEATPLVIGFAEWKLPAVAPRPCSSSARKPRAAGLQPWNVVEGSVSALVDPECGGGRPELFRAPGNLGLGCNRRDPRSKSAGGGGHQGHPFLHHHALCLHYD